MIVVDTSALIAIVSLEPDADLCREAIEGSGRVLMSAGTVVEALIVSRRRNLDAPMRAIIERTVTQIIDVTPERTQRIVSAYDRWGKGVHPASLNFGDCFAYAAAEEFSCPLLYIGHDFARTDILSAIVAARIEG